jgi:hypothetical protein
LRVLRVFGSNDLTTLVDVASANHQSLDPLTHTVHHLLHLGRRRGRGRVEHWLEDTALRLFEALWRMDFLAVDLSRMHRQVSS